MNAIVKGSTTQVAQAQGMSLAQAFVSVDVMVVIDLSGSMDMQDAPSGGGIISRRSAAREQLEKLQYDHAGRIGLIAFADRAEYLPGGNIDGVDVGGGTDMLEGLRMAMPASNAGIPLVVISDGEPNWGLEEDCLALAGLMQSPLHCIYVGPEGGRGFAFLQRLARAAGDYGKARTSTTIGEFLQEIESTLLLG